MWMISNAARSRKPFVSCLAIMIWLGVAASGQEPQPPGARITPTRDDEAPSPDQSPMARVTGRVVTDIPDVRVADLPIGLQLTDRTIARIKRSTPLPPPGGKLPPLFGSTRTDDQGRFTIEGPWEGEANILLEALPPDGPWTCAAAEGVELVPGQAAEVTIELVRGVLVEGQVVEAPGGQPVEGAKLGLYGPPRPRSGGAILPCVTDEQGRYRFRVPAGECYVYVQVPANGYTWPGGHPNNASQTIQVPADEERLTAPPLHLIKGVHRPGMIGAMPKAK